MGQWHQRHLALVGPTASGKSELALEVARLLPDIELVSVDSMAVYRHMDIGTAKPSASDRSGLAYHMVDLVEPCEEYSVAEYQREARQVLLEIAARGHRALLVGGTALYMRAVVDELEVPERWPEVAQLLAGELHGAGARRAQVLREMHGRLGVLDPVAASRISPGNERRLLRALEVTIGSGRAFSSYGPGLSEHRRSCFRLIGMDVGRDEVYRRIDSRLRMQLSAGWLEEVRTLLARPGGMSRTARQALGYRQLIEHIEEGVALDETVARAISATRRLCRRQLSWFHRDPRVEWLKPFAARSAVLGELDR